jgi:tetratricopeptide (TPR) repeat protein
MFLGLVLFLHIAGSTQSPSRPKAVSASELEKLAQESVAEKDWDIAADEFRRAIELQPRNSRLRVELGDSLSAAQEFPAAIAAFNEALQIDPRNEAAELGLAEAYRRVFNYDETRKFLERAKLEHSSSAAPRIALGRLEIELQHYDRAIEELQAAVKLAPRDLGARNDLAAAYQAKGDLPQALGQLDVVLVRDNSNAFAHFLRAQIYADRDDTADALPDAEAVVAAQPNNTRGRILLGKILLRVPNCARAIEILKPLESASPPESDALFLLARAYQCGGDAASARRATAEFEQSSKADRAANENSTQAAHLVHEANELAIKNQFGEAMDLLRQALEKDPANGDANAQLAKLLYSKGDLTNAAESIQKALAAHPYNPDYLYVWGKILEKENRAEDALLAFEKITQVNPKESDAFFEIGAIHEQKGDRSQARQAYKKAVELSPDDPDYRKALESVK